MQSEKSLSQAISSGNIYECRACNVLPVVGSVPSTKTTTSIKLWFKKDSSSSRL